MDDDTRTERERRTDDAMGRAVDELDALQSMTGCTKTLPVQTMLNDYVEEMKARAKELDEELDKDERLLLDELCKFFWDERTRSDEEKREEVVRAKEIIEKLRMDVNYKVLGWNDKTLLSGSVNHSLGMMEMLIEKGADVNLGSGMAVETPLDAILDEEDFDDGQLSEEKKAMKSLLLSKNALTEEERWNEKAAWARQQMSD